MCVLKEALSKRIEEKNMSELTDFLNLLRGQVGRGIYVWGGNGQDLNAMSDPIAWIERREEDPENEKRDIALYEKRKKDGVNPIQAFDCSGLVYWALHTAMAIWALASAK